MVDRVGTLHDRPIARRSVFHSMLLVRVHSFAVSPVMFANRTIEDAKSASLGTQDHS